MAHWRVDRGALRSLEYPWLGHGGVRSILESGGKSGLRRAECRVTPGEGNLEESATEKIPPRVSKALAARRGGKATW